MNPIAPGAFLAYRQFMLWRLVNKPGQAKPQKVPVSPYTGRIADAHDVALWVDYATAEACVKVFIDCGICFVLSSSDPFFFIDIDNCREPEGWSGLAQTICGLFSGAAIEVSQSGNGLHVFGTGRIGEHACKNKKLGIEFYTEKRFIALTGINAVGDASIDFTAALPSFVSQFFPPNIEGNDDHQIANNWIDKAEDGYTGWEDDDELIEKMLSSKFGLGVILKGKASVADLWNRNVVVLATAYPENDPAKEFGYSEADGALAQHLAFWTGKNTARICRLMFRSKLVRDKWTKHKTYLWLTITRACKRQDNIYNFERKQPKVTSVQIEAQRAEGVQWLTAEQQKEHFDRCVYIQDLHKVFIPDGSTLKPDQFKVKFGGFTFSMDALNDKTSRNAWEVFTESQAVRFPKVQSTCFKPELPSGAVVNEEGRLLINIYVPIETRRVKGDPSPFLTHLHKLFPVERDRAIMLAYMAAVVQYPGKKFQWCPVIQGVEGNGKTLFTRVLSQAVGHRYTHLPNAQQLGSGGSVFTGWLREKLFIGIEEITLADHEDILDALKPLITNDRIEIQNKGVDQYTFDNRANFLMNANKKGSIAVGFDKRRYAIFFTPQQKAIDITRDGISGNYFPALYEWLYRDGYAIVNEYLHTYAIPDELNPATSLQRAPDTSSTLEMHSLSMSPVEQEINEAIESGRWGFAGGWISSLMLDQLLRERTKRTIAHRQRREMLNNLGYDWHPALPNGRVNAPILRESGKPVLFIRLDHPAREMKDIPHVVQTYIDAQRAAEQVASYLPVDGNVVPIRK